MRIIVPNMILGPQRTKRRRASLERHSAGNRCSSKGRRRLQGRGVRALCAVAAVVFGSCTGTARGEFDSLFTGATLRIDYDHVGTATEEHFALERARVEGPWAGSRTRLIDTMNLGKYLAEIVDTATNRVIFSFGFASIYGEWETTAEARSGVWRSVPEAVRIPEPRGVFQLRIRKRGADGQFREVWAVGIDPASRFTDRAPLPQRDVWTVLEHGDPAVKVDILILGDGYTKSESSKFRADVTKVMDVFFATEPYASRKTDFNVRAIHAAASHSGITRPRAGVFRDSPLAARYNTFDSERYVLTLDDRAWRDVAAAAPYDFVIILVNERKYGGGGIFQLYCTASASSTFASYLVLHEFGHHFAALADEYYTSPVAYTKNDGTRREPWEPNVTALANPETLKWRDLVATDTPVPTPWPKDNYETQSRAFQAKRRALRENGASEDAVEALFRQEKSVVSKLLGGHEQAGRVGAFEGAMYEARGYYRPSIDCIMFTRDDVGYCSVCRGAIERMIDRYTR